MLNAVKAHATKPTFIEYDAYMARFGGKKKAARKPSRHRSTLREVLSTHPTKTNKRPDQFMTLAEANRLLEEQVRKSGRCRDNLKHKQPLGHLAKDGIDFGFDDDDNDVTIGSNHCSGKGRHFEQSNKDEEGFHRQPYFKGRERKPRYFATIQVGSIDPKKQGQKN